MRIKSFGRNKEPFIRGPQASKRVRLPWSKYLYLGILALILLGVAVWGFEKLFYVIGAGVLESETMSIKPTINARITSISCAVNDMVQGGGTLAVLDTTEMNLKIATKERELEERKTSFDLNLKEADSQVRFYEQEQKNNDRLVNDLFREYVRAENLLSAQAVTRPQVLTIKAELKHAQAALAIATTRLASARKTLDGLKLEFADFEEKLLKELQELHAHQQESLLVAPRAGIVAMIYRQAGDMVQTGEPVIELADISANFIKAYFEGADENRFKEGDKVEVIFQNGDESEGIIRKIYPAAYPLPQEYKKKYSPEERFIVAEIVPREGTSWCHILKTKAEIKLLRNWF